MYFSFLYISLPFLSFPRREMMCFKFAVMWKTWRHNDKFSFFFLLSSNRWYLFYSRILRKRFAVKMTWNNWEIITETRSSIFGWRSRCRRRRPCLSSLKLNFGHFLSSIHALNLPYNRLFSVLFGLQSVDKWEKNHCVSLESSGCKFIGLWYTV